MTCEEKVNILFIICLLLIWMPVIFKAIEMIKNKKP